MQLIPERCKLADWFTDYGRDHQTRGNLICHYVGIPTIVVSLMGLLGQVKWLVPFGAGILELNLGQVLLLAGTAWYLTLAWQLAVAFFPVILAAYVIGQLLPLPVLWGLFAFGWILQFVGHGIFEKKKPAFFKNILQLLIGPFWIFKKFVDWVR